MAKYISVLDSNINDTYWTAVQWAETRRELDENNYYTAGVNLSLPKNANDQLMDGKTIREVRTGKTASATVVKIAVESSNVIKLATHTASKQFIKSIEKSFS